MKNVLLSPSDPALFYRYDRTARSISSPDALTDADIEAYHRDGFLAVEKVLTPDETRAAKAALADMVDERASGDYTLLPEPDRQSDWDAAPVGGRAHLVRKVWKFVVADERLGALATGHRQIEAILTRLLGEPSRMIQDMALLKPPHIGSEKPWHQDMAYFGWGPPEKLIGVWIALDPATAENGCMHLIPGTHHNGAIPHHHVRDCQIQDDHVDVDRDVLAPLAPGGALFFSSLVHHGTPPNNSPARRWAIQYHYAAQSAEKVTVEEHARLFFEGDTYAGCRAGGGKPIALSDLPRFI